MIYSADQIASALGPDTPDCNCSGCLAIRSVKALICDQVTAHDTAQLEAYKAKKALHADANCPAPTWLVVLIIAAHRAASQGVSLDVIYATMRQGVDQSFMLNPQLHYVANSRYRPI